MEKEKKISAADALALPIPERIQLVEDIWDTIAENAEGIELSDAEKKTIDERLDSYHQNPQLGSPWEEILKKLKNR